MIGQVISTLGCVVVGRVVVFEQGCFCREKFYAIGRHPELSKLGHVKSVNGLRGQEIELTVDTITPIGVIEVRDVET